MYPKIVVLLAAACHGGEQMIQQQTNQMCQILHLDLRLRQMGQHVCIQQVFRHSSAAAGGLALVLRVLTDASRQHRQGIRLAESGFILCKTNCALGCAPWMCAAAWHTAVGTECRWMPIVQSVESFCKWLGCHRSRTHRTAIEQVPHAGSTSTKR